MKPLIVTLLLRSRALAPFLIIAACAPRIPPATPTSPAPFVRPAGTSGPMESVTPSATRTTNLFEIPLGAVSPGGGSSSPVVVTASWTPDGASAFIATAAAYGARPLTWSSFNTASRALVQLSDPPILDYFFDSLAEYPEFQGLRSPSGRYQFDLNSSGLWLIDNDSQNRHLLRGSTFSRFWKADWSRDEKTALLLLGYEGPGEALLVTTNEPAVSSLSDLMNTSPPLLVEGEFELSPSGTHVAFNDPWGVTIFDLPSRRSSRLIGAGQMLRWSDDGEALYYWDDDIYSTAEVDRLMRFSLAQNQLEEVLPASYLRDINICQNICGFDVTPDGSRILLWDSWQAWILTVER